MAKKRRKKKSAVVPVLKFVGVMAIGGVIGHYATKAWIKHVDPGKRIAEGDDELEPVENPTPVQGFVQPALPQMPMQIAPPTIVPMPLVPFPQFMPMGQPQPQPAAPPTSHAALPRAEVLSRAEALRKKRKQRERDADELLSRIAADLDSYYELPRSA